MIQIEKIIPGGQALGTDENGKKIFFWNALPQEIVSKFEIIKSKSRYSEAIATEILKPSSFRVKAKDECFLSTSPWQMINYEYELKLKAELVAEFFREHKINISLPEVITDGKDYFYRNKMEYALYWDHDDNKIKLALHARNSHRKNPIHQSSLERPELFQRACQIIDELNDKHEEARKYQSLLLRCNQNGETSGGLYENGKPHPVFQNLTDEILGHEYSYSPNGFFQINLPVYELALAEMKKHINTNIVLDLYAGVGTIGLSVAHDRTLILVECDRFAFGELVKNIAIDDISRPTGSELVRNPVTTDATKCVRNGNIFAVLSKSEEALDFIMSDATVILDPPRAGCDLKLVNKLLEVTPPKIIYLSCNPATQARDVSILLKKYHMTDIKTFNFFPHTPHIENLVVLSL